MSDAWGLLSAAVYLPSRVVDRQEIDRAHSRSESAPGTKLVAGPDEDAVTMAVAAVRALPELDRHGAQDLYLSSTTVPYADKVNATIVHAASGVDAGCQPMDVAGLRGGAAALMAVARHGGIAALSDVRLHLPGTADERASGDGAAAFMFGLGADPLASVAAVASVNVETLDWWRRPGDRYASQWEERFVVHALSSRCQDLKDRLGMDDESAVELVVASPSPRVVAAVASALGLPLAAAQAEHGARVGYAGAADVGLLLVSALQGAEAGRRILAVSAVGGLDGLLLDVRRPLPRPQAARPAVTPYLRYLTWRGLLDHDGGRRPPRPLTSAPAIQRRAEWKFGLVGGRCLTCKEIHLPTAPRCRGCGGTEMEPYPVADRAARVASTATDSLTDAGGDLARVAQIDFDGGGRMTVEMTDVAADGLRSGDPVEMTFRRLFVEDGRPNYFWKARPKVEDGR